MGVLVVVGAAVAAGGHCQRHNHYSRSGGVGVVEVEGRGQGGRLH